MPVAIMDSEAAELVVVATTMLSAALVARTRRADPEKILSNSLILQAHKLSTVIAQLEAGDPPEWDHMTQNRQDELRALFQMATADDFKAGRVQIVGRIRALLNAVHFPGEEPQGRLPLSEVQAADPRPETDM